MFVTLRRLLSAPVSPGPWPGLRGVGSGCLIRTPGRHGVSTAAAAAAAGAAPSALPGELHLVVRPAFLLEQPAWVRTRVEGKLDTSLTHVRPGTPAQSVEELTLHIKLVQPALPGPLAVATRLPLAGGCRVEHFAAAVNGLLERAYPEAAAMDPVRGVLLRGKGVDWASPMASLVEAGAVSVTTASGRKLPVNAGLAIGDGFCREKDDLRSAMIKLAFLHVVLLFFIMIRRAQSVREFEELHAEMERRDPELTEMADELMKKGIEDQE